ncbi:MAG: hypothetical protein Q7S00_05565, partial [bacterium]|nr:hypothetical protein [bacterium]
NEGGANETPPTGTPSSSIPPAGNLTSTAPLPFSIGTLPPDLGRAPLSLPLEATLSPLPGLIEGGLLLLPGERPLLEPPFSEGRFFPNDSTRLRLPIEIR